MWASDNVLNEGPTMCWISLLLLCGGGNRQRLNNVSKVSQLVIKKYQLLLLFLSSHVDHCSKAVLPNMVATGHM